MTEASLEADGDDLAARAAWLYFAGGLTQAEIARRFGITGVKAHRLISRARAEGAVRVFVDQPVAGCLRLEEAIARAFGLEMVWVAPDLAETGSLPLRALGLRGAQYLMNVLASRSHGVVGIGHGRTLTAAVEALPRIEAGGTRFVSLLGGLTRKYAANPYDVIHRLAERTGAEAFMMPAPILANTPEDKRVLLSQWGMARIMETIGAASLCLVGVGTVDEQGVLAAADPEQGAAEREELLGAGAAAEVLGQFLDAEGRPVATRLNGCAMAPDLASLRGREVVALAGGREKLAAIRSVLRAGLLTGLITDEATARGLVTETSDPAEARNGGLQRRGE